MTAFIRRFREVPTLETLTEIEQIALVDNTPRTPTTGVGAGALLLVGEFEDGPFNTPTEVFGENDEQNQFGGFGYTYGGQRYQNACARRHLGELWNGNGFLKGKYLRPPRKMICRVDTSVGTVRFSPLASLRTAPGPFRLATTDTMNITPDGGGAVAFPSLAGVLAATVTGIAFGDDSGFVGGEQIGVTIDNSPEVIITFRPGDITAAQVVARLQQQLGANASLVGATVKLDGNIVGASGKIVTRDVTAGALAAIGLTANTFNGVGLVAGQTIADLTAVSAATLAAIITTLAGISAFADSAGRVAIASDTPISGTIQVDDSGGTSLAANLGLTDQLGIAVSALIGPATTIPAGTRVSTAATGQPRWVTMRTIVVVEGTSSVPNESFFDVEVRPELDDGTAAAAAGAVDTVIDILDDRLFSVVDIVAPTAALTEAQLDVRYETAFDATIDVAKVTREATISLSARRSDAVVRKGRLNAIDASDNGNRGRTFHTRAAFGQTPAVALADVVNYRHDRVFYSHPNWQARIPEIAEVGAAAGGLGFTDDGIITIGADGPLAYINSVIPPEQNPGQDTGLLGFVVGLEPIPAADLTIANYIAYKAAGICAPRVDQRGTPVYQSEVTTDLTPGRTTQKRRKFADFIQDSIAVLLLPFSKKLATDSREAAIDAVVDNFLGGLLSADQPDLQRIADYSLVNTSRQNPELLRRGISARKIQVQQLSSLDTFLVDTEIGEGVVVVRAA